MNIVIGLNGVQFSRMGAIIPFRVQFGINLHEGAFLKTRKCKSIPN